MTEADIDHFRQKLLALKRRLGGQLSQLEEEALRGTGGEARGNLSNLPLHPADLGTDNYEEEVALELLVTQADLLTEVQDALTRIDQGTFGRCENCGQEIRRERLEALPYARHCLPCAGQLQADGGD
jgi:RNA polymerase-binding protein DksA